MGLCTSRNDAENNKINSLIEQNNRLKHQLKKVLKKNLDYEKKLTHIEDILGTPEAVAESILESSINCEWVDNKKEYEYLIDVVSFIHEACNDLSCGRLSVSLG